ncbi:hypothetical protein FGM00_10140 [Aggregatimonas sangjinii]|uniref:SnoaL-like domain-containing protein n=1 Tax=Aggregatimonas sangjinii TaxID=2583587 RepID=A0A5B7SUW1_9FLAO|nr:nuclear transport factor 2 family protein [Aggregatimonas sangjinii]QCX00454.1 hypothetical protein FGM00_10140 [Aggregatimonas sangjinii]
MRYPKILFGIFFILALLSCKDQSEKKPDNTDTDIKLNNEKLLTAMNAHMQAISDRDLVALKSTLSPNGNMQLILPGMEMIETVDGFMEYHRQWFEAENWTFNYDILNSEVGDTMGMVVMSFTYKEPERDGEPYFNRMIISYDLQKIDGAWYVIKDHASSVEKSTDQK